MTWHGFSTKYSRKASQIIDHLDIEKCERLSSLDRALVLVVIHLCGVFRICHVSYLWWLLLVFFLHGPLVLNCPTNATASVCICLPRLFFLDSSSISIFIVSFHKILEHSQLSQPDLYRQHTLPTNSPSGLISTTSPFVLL